MLHGGGDAPDLGRYCKSRSSSAHLLSVPIHTTFSRKYRMSSSKSLRPRHSDTAESMVWRFSEARDEMYLDVEWMCEGERRSDTYLSSNVDLRYVHLVESSTYEEMTA